jgi:hypothetical protein
VSGDRCIQLASRQLALVRLGLGQEHRWLLRDHRVREADRVDQHDVRDNDMCRVA